VSRTTTHDRPIRRDVLAVAAVAVVVRLLWVIPTARTPRGLSDPILYFRSAVAMANGGGYQSLFGEATAYYPPGFPMFLAAQKWLLDLIGLGDHLAFVNGLLGALLGGVAAGALVVAGRRAGVAVARSEPSGRFASTVGLAGGLVFACWPNLVFYSGAVLSEPLFLACFSVFIAAALHVVDDGRLVMAPTIIAGVALGAATLVRPQVLLVVPALAAAWVISRVRWRTVLAGTGILVAGAVVFVAPWTVRNAAVFDTFVPLSTNTGHNLCIGFHEGATGGFAITNACETGQKYVDGPEAERSIDSTTRRRAVDWATSHIGSLPVLSLKKLWYTYDSDTDGLRGVESYEADPFLPDALRTTLKVIATVAYVLIMVGTVVGLVLAAGRGWRRRRDDVGGPALVAMTLASFVVPVFFFGDPRFKVAATPCYAILAGIAAAVLLGRLSPRISRTPPAPPEVPAESAIG